MKDKKSFQGLESHYMREQGMALFKWEDDPFVVTVTASRTANGYVTDWWISGISQKAFHYEGLGDSPKLMVRAQLGITSKENRIELENELHDIWLSNLKDLAFGSAIHGGIDKLEVQVDSELKSRIVEMHLHGHDRLGHFDAKSKESPVTERSARQYALLTSLGYPKAQKLIAQYETEQQAIEVLVGAIDRRLYTGRKLGMIPKKESAKPFFKNTSDF